MLQEYNDSRRCLVTQVDLQKEITDWRKWIVLLTRARVPTQQYHRLPYVSFTSQTLAFKKQC